MAIDHIDFIEIPDLHTASTFHARHDDKVRSKSEVAGIPYMDETLRAPHASESILYPGRRPFLSILAVMPIKKNA